MAEKDKILQIKDELFTLDDICFTNPDVVIRTNNNEVHISLMKLTTLRIGFVGEDIYTYLINGKLIQVNRKEE